MYARSIFFLLLMIPAVLSAQHKNTGNSVVYKLCLTGSDDSALIGHDHPDAADNQYGYEGGMALLQGNTFHLFVTEEPHHWVRTRTGHWVSNDGVKWKRRNTVQQSSDDSLNQRFAIWSPMPVYNDHEGRWNPFYVGYELNGTSHGKAFRAVSERKGPGGPDGPFTDLPGTVISFGDLPVLHLAENPIVQKLADGNYVAVYDDLTDLQRSILTKREGSGPG